MKIGFNLLLIPFVSLMVISCGGEKNLPEQTENQQATIEVAESNPAANGFNEQASDTKAIALADSVMNAMGGREAWDKTRYIAWNFFGSRKLIWDKFTGNVRVENVENDFKVLVNVHTLEGKVFKNGEELSQPDSLKKYLTRGKNIWINDSYWLVMPFKLKDSGVTLKYLSEDTVMDVPSHVLQLTFEEVGVTPENKYLVSVDKNTNLVNQWAFYRKIDDEEPGFTLPWQDYKKHGDILLSGNRGVRELSEIKVFEELPESVFTELADVDLSKYKAL